MTLRFLPEGPALVVENAERVLVIADLHIGIESDLEAHGVHIPSQGRGRLDRILACIEDGRPDLVLLLGDVKHSVPLTTRQEYRELPLLLREIRSRAPMKLVPGNHDGGIERFLEEGELLPARGALIDGVGYLHGHTYPDPSLLGHLLVIGHHHPMIALRDEVGCALRDRAYLLTSVDEGCLGLGDEGRGEGEPGPTRVLVMPAFNELTGYDLTGMGESTLGPLSRCMDFVNAEVFLTDGTYLGLLGCLGEE
jgi:metallophosphoesterase superfamily enzyme